MYKVYADDILIHDSYSPDNIIHLISPNLKIADNSAGSFEMTVPKGNPGYDVIKRFTTTIIVKKENQTIWTGRVINESEDFWKRRKFVCEGALSYLNDSLQELAYYDNYTLVSFFTTLINTHNIKVPENRRLTVGTISMTDATENYAYKTDYKNTLEVIRDTFSNRLGGHIRIRYAENSNVPIIDYLKDYPNTSSQEINFGHNLLDFTKQWDISNISTVILPRGKQLDTENEHGDREYLTIESVNNGSKYLKNVDGVQEFGEIETVVDFNEIEDPTLLKQMGETYLSSLQFDKMVLTVSAIDLHILNPDIVSFELLDQVRCYSAPHGLNKVIPITEIDIPLDSPENVKYVMGSAESSSLSAVSSSANKALANAIDITGGNLLSEAKRHANNLINQKTTGYVNIITEQETSQALIISNTPDLQTATKLWRWNLNGLGYLDKTRNPNGDYSLAITNNGVIVADFIKTGVIDDGHGYNRWNLNTGEFQMAYNSAFANALGNTITIVDVVNLAQTAQDSADTALAKRSGGTNILRGTNKNISVVSSGTSQWTEGTWDGTQGDAAQKSIVDISGSPNPSITKGFKIILSTDSSTSFVQQANVDVAATNTYTISCYAKGSASEIKLGCRYPNSSNSDMDVVSPLDANNWKRYYFTFTVPNNAVAVSVLFGASGNNGQTCYICGMKMERGNTASDWSESEWDTYGRSTTSSNDYTDATANALKTYSKNYTDAISKNDREFTQAQRQALDESFTQYKVLQRLTNDFTAKGIYLRDNELYMNATYVRTGTLDAGIIKAGILTDARENNKWNLATGYLYTTNMEAVNMKASGRFECGSSYKLVMSDGIINGYQGSSWVGALEPTANVRDIDTGQMLKGITLRGQGIVEVRTPCFAMRERNDNGASTKGKTTTFRYSVVSDVSVGSGSIRVSTTEHGIKVINGIVVNVW